MLNKNALRGFTVGVLAATIVALGVWPVLAHDSDQLLPTDYELAPHAAGSPGGSPGAEEFDRVAADEVSGQGFGGSSPLVVPAAAFRNDGDDAGDYWFYFWGGYVQGEDPNTDSTFMMAPAYLPHGAIVTSVYAYLYDNDSSEDIDVTLTRARNMTGVTDVMAFVSTSGASNSIQYLGDTTISPDDVDSPYSYYVTVELPSSSTALWAVRIFYEEPNGEEEHFTYLPLVLKNFFCDRYEPNDHRPINGGTPWGPLASGQIIDDAQICQGDPRDIYYFNANSSVQVTIDLTNMSGNTNFDLYLWDETGSNPLDESENGAGQDEQIVYTLPGAGSYYVDVYPWSGTGSYTLQGSGW